MRYALLRTGGQDAPQMSRALGVLYVSGGLLVLLSLLLPHPDDANKSGLIAIVGIGLVVGSASIIWARHARVWVVHGVLAAGTTCICLCVYFAGVDLGIYSFMFVWVVLMAGTFFSGRAVAGHVLWILVGWGLALTTVDELSGFSAITRWSLGGFVLIVTAVVLSETVAGRRSSEAELRGQVEERRRLQAELEHLAHHDPLTGIANRRLFDKELAQGLARARRHDSPLSVIALDLNDFKRFNDEQGHAAGDRLLKLAAAMWTDVLRGEDLIARIGGDEFAVLLGDCPPAEAERVAQRLSVGCPPDQACCTGVASWNGWESGEELLARADRAMYQAKDRASPQAVVARLRRDHEAARR